MIPYDRSSSQMALMDAQENDSDIGSFGSLSIKPDDLEASPGARRRQKKIGLSDFNFIKVLGKGSFGKVRTNSSCSSHKSGLRFSLVICNLSNSRKDA